jgi:hypothetical protein
MNLCAAFLSKKVALVTWVLLVLLANPGKPQAQEKPMYFSKPWRDSVAEYHGRLTAYHQELYSYDWATTFSRLPVAGEWYVDKTGTGIAFFAGRLLALSATTVGTVRLIERKSNTPLNIGLLAGGIVSYFLLKWWEVSDVMHTVSDKNEALVKEYNVNPADVEPGSIRFPSK